MKCLVTGAAGFIGSHLCARLLREGHDVVGLDNLSEGSLESLKDAPDVALIKGDLRSERTVTRAAAGCDVIFHQGALRSVFRSMRDPQATAKVNLGGTLNVLMAARSKGCRVVFASSSSVYGRQTEYPLHEQQHPVPCSPYAASKLAGEAYCQTWWRAFGIPTVSLRYFNVYGPRQDATGEYAVVIPKFILACLTGKPPIIEGDGNQARDFAYIDDVIDANLAAATTPEHAWGAVYNVGGGNTPTTMNELLGMVASLTGTSPQPTFAPSRPGDVRWTHADLTLSRAVLGYRPRVGMQEGLQRTVEWFRANAPAPQVHLARS